MPQDDLTDYAILSTTDGELHIEEASNWGGALAEYLEAASFDHESMFVTPDQEPYEHWTVDTYADGREECVIVLRLDDLKVGEPHSFPHPDIE